MEKELYIGEIEQKKIDRLVEHARNNIFSFEKLLAITSGELAVPGATDEFAVYLPYGYRVVFTIEQQPKQIFKHISISTAWNRFPSYEVCDRICTAFGFADIKYNCTGWIKENALAINIVQPL